MLKAGMLKGFVDSPGRPVLSLANVWVGLTMPTRGQQKWFGSEPVDWQKHQSYGNPRTQRCTIFAFKKTTNPKAQGPTLIMPSPQCFFVRGHLCQLAQGAICIKIVPDDPILSNHVRETDRGNVLYDSKRMNE
uniref:Uncharacterized protein n=1 Tax=Romanomermis culicivorax TaxID=13658 RepID=A0A915K8N3_ROMCU